MEGWVLTKRRMTAEDLLALKFHGDPQISPNGESVAYVQVRIDKNENDKAPKADEHVYRSNIWLAPFHGGEARQFTFGKGKDHSPRWSPCGHKLAFVSDRAEGKNQIWLIDLAGGEASQLTKLKTGAGSPVWSPDGSKIAFVSRTNAEDEAAVAGEKKEEVKKSDVKVVDSLRYKSNGIPHPGIVDGKWAHIWVIEVATGAAKQLTFGDWDDAGPVWTPDGKAIAFSSYRGPEPDFAMKRDIWQVSIDGGEAKMLVEHPGPAGEIAFSPDGKTLAYLGHDMHLDGATNTSLWLAPANGGAGTCVKNGDLSLGSGINGDSHAPTGNGGVRLTWAPDGQSVYCTATEAGKASLYRFPVAGGKPETIIGGNRAVCAVSFDAAVKRCAFLAETAVQPCEVFGRAECGCETQLSHGNDALLSEIELTQPEEFWFKGADGWDMQAWLMKPAGFESGKKYPVVFEIHGGPHTAFGYGFFHEFHFLAAQDQGVLFVNPRGSTSYGENFTYACVADWGGKDFQDLMLGVDYAIANNSWIDGERLGVTGGSYGGFMTNWVVTHTNRFKAAVTQRCLSNLYSFFGTSDIGWFFGERQYKGLPWDDEDKIMEHSPIRHVKNVTTPLLILHSESDIRCPIEQGEQMFVALKCLHKETQLVRFPDESHELSRSGKPAHRIERLERMNGWMKRFIK